MRFWKKVLSQGYNILTLAFETIEILIFFTVVLDVAILQTQKIVLSPNVKLAVAFGRRH